MDVLSCLNILLFVDQIKIYTVEFVNWVILCELRNYKAALTMINTSNNTIYEVQNSKSKPSSSLSTKVIEYISFKLNIKLLE